MKMKTLVKIVTAGVLATSMSGANAYCTLTGNVVRMLDYTGSGYGYIKTSSLSTVYYRAYTPDTDLKNALRSCMNSGHKCRVQTGTSTSVCPTTGTGRIMPGSVLNIYANYP